MVKELRGIVWLVATLWVVHLADVVLPIDFNLYGLVPRTAWGLIGIPLMPLLHASWGHLLGNTIPLCILLFILLGSRCDYMEVILSIIIGGGVLLWCFGRSAVHVGASGFVYGLVAFLIASGFLDRKPVSILVALLVGFLYGATLLFGVLPIVGTAVSWEGHLFGAIAGVGAAFALAKNASENESQSSAELNT
jgi:membrane associated rhomboid family serine protease